VLHGTLGEGETSLAPAPAGHRPDRRRQVAPDPRWGRCAGRRPV